MGRPQRKNANDHAVGVLPMIPFFITALLYHLVYVNPTPGLITTMGITMRTLISKDKPTNRAIITTAATPKEQRSKRLAKSPRSVNVNSLLAEINLPMNHYNNVLEALRPPTSPTDEGLSDPCDITLPTDKNWHVTQLLFPTGVDMKAIGFHAPVDNAPTQTNESPQDQTTPPSRSVCISKTATSVETNSKNTSGTSQ
jgi:hypothetical protein